MERERALDVKTKDQGILLYSLEAKGTNENPVSILIRLYEQKERAFLDRDRKKIIATLYEISGIYQDLEDWEEAITIYEQIHKLDKGDSYCIAMLAIAYLRNKNLPAGIKALKKCDHTQTKCLEILCQYAKGLYLQLTDDKSGAKKCFNQALKISIQLNWQEYTIRTKIRLAELAKENNQPDQAIKLLRSLIEKQEDDILLINVYRILSESYSSLGNTNQSFGYLKEYCRLRDKYWSQANIRKAEELKHRQDTKDLCLNRHFDNALHWIVYDLVNMNINNQLRQPVNIIRLYLENLKMKLENQPGNYPAYLREDLQAITEEFDQIETVGKDLEQIRIKQSDFSDQESERGDIVIKTIVGTFIPYIESQKIHFHLSDAEPGKTYWINKETLSLLIITMLDFSVKALNSCDNGLRDIICSHGIFDEDNFYIKFTYSNSRLFDIIETCHTCPSPIEEKFEIGDFRISFDIFKYLISRAGGRYVHEIAGNQAQFYVIIPGGSK